MREEYRYILERGSKKHYCPDCGKKRLVRYIDTQTGNYLPEQYGRCDRESKCSYHLNPYLDGYAKAIQEQEQGNRSGLPTSWKPKRKKAIPQPTPAPVFFDFETFKQTLQPERYEKNTFIQNLFYRVQFPFEVDEVTKVIQLYRLGTVANGYRAGANTFPFIDIKGNVRAIQVKQFDEHNHTTGTDFLHSIIQKHHTRNNKPLPDWLEAYNKNETKVSCLFGEHLLSKYPYNPVALVEAPKTAVYGTLYFGFPEQPTNLLWLAVYNLSSLNLNKCKALKGRNVYLFPDLSKDGKAFELWSNKAAEIQKRLQGAYLHVSDLLEQLAPEQDREEGQDLADYLIRLDWRPFRQPAAPTPARPATPIPTAAVTAAVTTTDTELHKPQPEEEHQTAPTPAPAPTAAPTPARQTPAPATTAQVRRTATTEATPGGDIATDQTDMIIQARTDYSEAQIIQAIERIDKGSNGRQRLNRLIDEGKLHRCKATKAIYYVPF